jgi:FkbM family methyltransferase
MPTSIEEHIVYTQNELRDLPYYQQMFSVLKTEPITSYLDIGANTGEYAKNVCNNIPTIEKCFLIEPENVNFNFMVSHLDDLEQCVFYNFAIGYDSVCGNLLRNSNTGGHQIEKLSSGGDVQIRTLESLEILVVDLLKMDVEGMEYEIIQKSSYLKKVKWLDIEFHQTLEQSKNHFVKKFILENLPTFDIIVYENDGVNDYGRCLLKNRI